MTRTSQTTSTDPSANGDTAATQADLRGGAMQVSRSRGALSGFALIILGAWGALIPFIGPYFNLSYLPDTAWHWTDARGWLEVLPGAAAFLGGVLSLASRNRAVISFGAWIGVAAGAWFVIGRDVMDWFNIGSPGRPAGTSTAIQSVESLVMFSGLGALIMFFAAVAVGRLSVRAVRDVRVAQRRAARVAKRDRAVEETAYERGRREAFAEAEAREKQRAEQGSTVGHQYPAAPPPPPADTTGRQTAEGYGTPTTSTAAEPTRTEPVTERDTRATR